MRGCCLEYPLFCEKFLFFSLVCRIHGTLSFFFYLPRIENKEGGYFADLIEVSL